jgi:hypothetical protein
VSPRDAGHTVVVFHYSFEKPADVHGPVFEQLVWGGSVFRAGKWIDPFSGPYLLVEHLVGNKAIIPCSSCGLLSQRPVLKRPVKAGLMPVCRVEELKLS